MAGKSGTFEYQFQFILSRRVRGTKLVLFKISFQNILTQRAKMYWNMIWKSPGFSHMGPIWPILEPNMTSHVITILVEVAYDATHDASLNKTTCESNGRLPTQNTGCCRVLTLAIVGPLHVTRQILCRFDRYNAQQGGWNKLVNTVLSICIIYEYWERVYNFEDIIIS